MIPKNPMILLSYVNTELRDYYPSFQAFCEDKQVDGEKIIEKLRMIDYEYDADLNKFV